MTTEEDALILAKNKLSIWTIEEIAVWYLWWNLIGKGQNEKRKMS